MGLEGPGHCPGHTLSRKSSHCTHSTSVPHVQITSESLLRRKHPEYVSPATKTREPWGRSRRTESRAHVPWPGTALHSSGHQETQPRLFPEPSARVAGASDPQGLTRCEGDRERRAALSRQPRDTGLARPLVSPCSREEASCVVTTILLGPHGLCPKSCPTTRPVFGQVP